jgi:hypothetical protein
MTHVLPSNPRPQIFISYRRGESEHVVGRLAEDLRRHYGPDCIVQDMFDVEAGANITEVLQDALRRCAAVLVIIGPRWVDMTDFKGRQRLRQPDDSLRREVAESLKWRGLRVFRVLIDHAEMPGADELPPDIRGILRRAGFSLTARHWENDVRELIRALDSAVRHRMVTGYAAANAREAPERDLDVVTEGRLEDDGEAAVAARASASVKAALAGRTSRPPYSHELFVWCPSRDQERYGEWLSALSQDLDAAACRYINRPLRSLIGRVTDTGGLPVEHEACRVMLVIASGNLVHDAQAWSQLHDLSAKKLWQKGLVVAEIEKPSPALPWYGDSPLRFFRAKNPACPLGFPPENRDPEYFDAVEQLTWKLLNSVKESMQRVPPPIPASVGGALSQKPVQELPLRSNSTIYDVFLCHNTDDKAEIRQIATALKQHGVRPWFDEWEIRPGRRWQSVLEDNLSTIGAAAVFVGTSGVGPWQNREIQAILDEYRDEDRPVIPVILANCRRPPQLPLFLRSLHWVDFRIATPDPLTQLIWGITGKRPSRT